MSDLEQWLAANDKYLAAQLDALRARLERLAGPDAPSQPADPKQGTWRTRFFSSKTGEASPPPVLLASPAEEPAATPQDGTPPPALMVLARRLGLNDFERNTLLLCAAMELDTAMGALCARAQYDPARPYPTFALALSLFDQPSWDVLSLERPLRHWRLIEIDQQGPRPLITSALHADERVVGFIKGLNTLDGRLAPLVTLQAASLDALPPSQAAVADAIGQSLERRDQSSRPPVYQLIGSDSASKLAVAALAATRLGLTLHRLPADALPTAWTELDNFTRLWQRECALLPVALYLDASQLDRAAAPATQAAIVRFLKRGAGLVFLDTREPWLELQPDTITLQPTKPTPSEQQSAWSAVLGGEDAELPARLAGQFNLDIDAIGAIAHQAGAAHAEAIWDACVAQSRPALDQLAQAIQPKATWDDLVLPAQETALLQQIAGQAGARMQVYDGMGFAERMNRGFGINVLFAGESGCGKTMAAEVIANALKLSLYRIDLSAVVSKFIGETEKNLRRLFDAAEGGGAILFFDEADALFGKRSEVKDSHDRYANIEINYLLQRMEAYRGLAILATNMRSAMDSAFLRRLRFVVDFAFPGVAEREAIWRKAFPARAKLQEPDFARLAKLSLTGGSIQNVALNAAFMAVSAGTGITMAMILEAARNEFVKLEKPVNYRDFPALSAVGGQA